MAAASPSTQIGNDVQKFFDQYMANYAKQMQALYLPQPSIKAEQKHVIPSGHPLNTAIIKAEPKHGVRQACYESDMREQMERMQYRSLPSIKAETKHESPLLNYVDLTGTDDDQPATIDLTQEDDGPQTESLLPMERVGREQWTRFVRFLTHLEPHQVYGLRIKEVEPVKLIRQSEVGHRTAIHILYKNTHNACPSGHL
jgi:hypothetical protein